MIASSVDKLIDQTQVIFFNQHHFKRIPRDSLIYAKLEYFNPGGVSKIDLVSS